MDAAEATRRWLAAYNSDKAWTDENFDFEMVDFLHGGPGFGRADPSTVLDVIVALARHDLTWQAKGFLGADIAEDLLADAPDLLPRIQAETDAEPRLRTVFAYAWETGRMGEEARAFLRRMQRWAAENDPEPEGLYPTEPRR